MAPTQSNTSSLLAKLERHPPPTNIASLAEAEKPSLDNDLEKAGNGLRTESDHPQQRPSPEAERAVIRKLDWRVLPLLAALYLLSFLDRSNIGNARIAGMEEDLKLTGNRYEWLLTIFYISYILFEPQVIMWKIVPAHIWAALIVFTWGFLATIQAAVHNWQGEMALRFLLGASEAGFGPGVPFLLSFFYLRHEIGSRVGIFLSAAPLANCFAGALAYGITSGNSKLANWRLLFLVEGLPTMIMAAVAFFFLPDSPSQARFLNEKEKTIAEARALRQVGHLDKRVGSINWKDVGAALLDPKCWFTAFMYFSCNVGFSSLPVFLPTILEGMGYTRINAQGLSAPPYFLSFLITIFSTFLADKWEQRGYMIMFLTTVGGIGYILLAACDIVAVRYFGVFLAAAGIFPTIANILPWVLNNQGSDTRRGVGIMLLNVIGQCGPLLGTNIFNSSDEPRYIKGMSICAAFTFFTGFLAFGLRLVLARENRKRDQEHGTLEEIAARQTGDPARYESTKGEEDYGATFRNIL